jgi:hypothetical protein
VAKRKNPMAVGLAKLRAKRLTAAQRRAIASLGGKASRASLTPAQRSESARKAGLAGGRGRRKGS